MKRILMTLGVIGSLVAGTASASQEDHTGVMFDQSMVRTDRLGEMVHVGLDNDGYFAVKEGGDVQRIQNADVDPELRKQALHDVLKHKMARKLHVKKYDNGEFKLQAADGLNGGGPVAAAIANFSTRFVGYTGSLCCLFFPGGQGLCIAGFQTTEIAAMYATAAALAAPTL